jgi:hypothetical protein
MRHKNEEALLILDYIWKTIKNFTEGYINYKRIVGFEVFTAMVLKSIFFWDMTPCSPLCSNRRFGGT